MNDIRLSEDYESNLRMQGFDAALRDPQAIWGMAYAPDLTHLKNADRFDAHAEAAAARTPAQMQAATIAQSQYADQQRQALAALQANAEGRGLAQAQVQQGMEAALAAQMAAAGSQRGVRIGATQGNLAQGAAAMQQQAGMQGAMTQMAAQQQYADALSGARQQDQAFNFQQAGLRQQAAQQNLGAAMQQAGLNDQMVQYYRSLGFGMAEAEQQARLQQAQMQMEATKTDMEVGQRREAAALQFASGLMSGIAGAFSDERLKKHVVSADDDAQEMLEALAAYSYDYKNEGHGEGRQFGIMAQDLERSNMGRSLVVDTPEGKVVRTDKAALAALAGLASLNKRLRAMEDGR